MNYKSLSPVEKLWGIEYWLVNTEAYCAKVLELNPGFQSSLHFHKVKDETFFIYSGQVVLELGEETKLLYPSDFCRIPPGAPHRFKALIPSIIIESSTHHDDADVVRLEPSRSL